RRVMESGLDRLALPRPLDAAARERLNELSARRLAASTDLAARWHDAIDTGTEGRVVPCVATQRRPPLREFLFGTTLKYTVYAAFGAGLAAAARVASAGATHASPSKLPIVLALIGVAGAFGALPGLARSAFLWARCRPADGSVRQIGLAVREALIETGLIAESSQGGVATEEIASGVWSVRLMGAGYPESRLFADAMEEVLGPV